MPSGAGEWNLVSGDLHNSINVYVAPKGIPNSSFLGDHDLLTDNDLSEGIGEGLLEDLDTRIAAVVRREADDAYFPHLEIVDVCLYLLDRDELSWQLSRAHVSMNIDISAFGYRIVQTAQHAEQRSVEQGLGPVHDLL